MLRRGGAQILEDNTLRSEEHLQKNTETSTGQVDLKQSETGEKPVFLSPAPAERAQTEIFLTPHQKKVPSIKPVFLKTPDQLQINPIMNIALSNDEFRETYGILDLAWEENEKNDPDHTITKEEYQDLMQKVGHNQTKFSKEKIPSILDAWEEFFTIQKGRYFFHDYPGFLQSPLWHSNMKWVIAEFPKDLDFLDEFLIEGGGDWVEVTDLVNSGKIKKDWEKYSHNTILNHSIKSLYRELEETYKEKKENSYIESEHNLLRYPGSSENIRTFAVANPKNLLKMWLIDWDKWPKPIDHINIKTDNFYPFEIVENVSWNHINRQDNNPNTETQINMFTRVHNNQIFKMWVFFNKVLGPDAYLYEYAKGYSKQSIKVSRELWGDNFLKNIMVWYWYMYKPGYGLDLLKYEKNNNWDVSVIKSWSTKKVSDALIPGKWNLLDIYRNYNIHNWTHQLFDEDRYQDMIPFINAWLSGFGRRDYSYWWTYIVNFHKGDKTNITPFSARWARINKIATSIKHNKWINNIRSRYPLYI